MQTAYMKLSSGKDGNMEYVWTDRHELTDISNAINICGDDRFGESKFSSAFDITLVHAENELVVSGFAYFLIIHCTF